MRSSRRSSRGRADRGAGRLLDADLRNIEAPSSLRVNRECQKPGEPAPLIRGGPHNRRVESDSAAMAARENAADENTFLVGVQQFFAGQDVQPRFRRGNNAAEHEEARGSDRCALCVVLATSGGENRWTDSAPHVAPANALVPARPRPCALPASDTPAVPSSRDLGASVILRPGPAPPDRLCSPAACLRLTPVNGYDNSVRSVLIRQDPCHPCSIAAWRCPREEGPGRPSKPQLCA